MAAEGNGAAPAPVKLLYVATVAAPIRNFLIPYAAHFRSLGWEVSAAACGATSVAALREAFDGVYELPLSRSIRDVGAMIRGERALASLLANGPDIVHVHTPIAGFVARLAVRRMPGRSRAAIVYTAHGFHFHHAGNAATNRAFLLAEQIAGRWTDRLIVINEEDRQAAEAARLVPRRNLVAIPGIGIDTTWYSRSRIGRAESLAALRRLEIGLETPLFVTVGEFHPNKRQADVIEALAAMRCRESHLVLLGDGPGRGDLERLAMARGVRDRVTFAGFVEDVRPIVGAATGLILASAREGLSRSVMEALALEIPVVASTARGNAELVGDDAGFIVRTGDVPAMARAMDRLIDRPAEGMQMGQVGRARVVARYAIDPVLRRHERVYEEILRERRRARS